MLLIILTTIFLLIIFSGFSSMTSNMYNEKSFLSIQLIKGVFIVGLIIAYLSIWLPLNIYIEIAILLIGLFFFLYNRQIIDFKNKFYYTKSFFFYVFVLVFVSSMNAFIFDTFSYYLPTIKWLDDYGLVKGLANFDFNLGQTSLWHILSASFNQTIDPYYKINFFISFIYVLFVYEVKKYSLLILVPFFYFFIASPSTDLPIIILSIIAIVNYKINQSDESILLGMIIGTMLILIKPIAFVLAIYFFILWMVEVKNKSYRELLILSSIGLLFIIKNSILTANITFPLPYGNISKLVYSIPKEIYDLSSIDGKYLATSRLNSVNYDEFRKWSSIQYYTYILKNINFSIFLYLLISFVCVFFLIYSILKKKKYLILLSFLLFFKVIIFIIISIQYRFILDNFLIITSLFLLKYKINTNLIQITVLLTSILMVFSNSIFGVNRLPYFMAGVKEYKIINLLEPTLYKPKTKEIKYSNFKANYITNTIFSLDVKQPALNKRLINQYNFQGYFPKLINENDIKEGFFLEKKSAEDKKDYK